MRNLYGHHFLLKPGVRCYVPTAFGEQRGHEIKRAIEGRWKIPKNFYHLRSGGHVAAAQLHRDAPWAASVDLHRFFDQISRQRVLRSLKILRFTYAEAWEMSCDSVVDKRPPHNKFSVPFGFIQSPIVASLVLAHSALGLAIKRLRRAGVSVSVYMDDITVSGETEAGVQAVYDELHIASATARLALNPDKVQPPARRVTNFNIEYGSGKMLVTEERMGKFKAAYQDANPYRQMGIYGYVATVDEDQAAELES